MSTYEGSVVKEEETEDGGQKIESQLYSELNYGKPPTPPDEIKLEGKLPSVVLEQPSSPATPTPQKRTGRRKINIEFIEEKSRRHITFSKRKAGIMKKAYELSTLTGTQVLLLVASETGHVYTFATPKLQPLITKVEGKNLIQACLNSSDLQNNQGAPASPSSPVPIPQQESHYPEQNLNHVLMMNEQQLDNSHYHQSNYSAPRDLMNPLRMPTSNPYPLQQVDHSSFSNHNNFQFPPTSSYSSTTGSYPSQSPYTPSQYGSGSSSQFGNAPYSQYASNSPGIHTQTQPPFHPGSSSLPQSNLSYSGEKFSLPVVRQ